MLKHAETCWNYLLMSFDSYFFELWTAQCMFGGLRLKKTCLASNNLAIVSLNILCNGDHEHAPWSMRDGVFWYSHAEMRSTRLNWQRLWPQLFWSPLQANLTYLMLRRFQRSSNFRTPFNSSRQAAFKTHVFAFGSWILAYCGGQQFAQGSTIFFGGWEFTAMHTFATGPTTSFWCLAAVNCSERLTEQGVKSVFLAFQCRIPLPCITRGTLNFLVLQEV